MNPAGYMGHIDMGLSPLAMMSMAEQYPWMKEKKPARKPQMPGKILSLKGLFTYLGFLKVNKIPSVSVEVNISFYCLALKDSYLQLDDEIDRKKDVTAIQSLLV